MIAATRNPFVDAMDMGLENALFRITGMFFHNNKFNPFQQTDPGQFFFGLLPPVDSIFYGDTVDFIKKQPAVRKIHGSFMVKKVDMASCCGENIKSILY